MRGCGDDMPDPVRTVAYEPFQLQRRITHPLLGRNIRHTCYVDRSVLSGRNQSTRAVVLRVHNLCTGITPRPFASVHQKRRESSLATAPANHRCQQQTLLRTDLCRANPVGHPDEESSVLYVEGVGLYRYGSTAVRRPSASGDRSPQQHSGDKWAAQEICFHHVRLFNHKSE